jgi:hypothetical protein
MLSLFFFAPAIENTVFSSGEFIFLYVSALVVSAVPGYLKNKQNARYSAVGASGAVSAVLFSCVLFMPWSLIYIKFIVLMSILLINLTVGISIGEIKTTIDESEIKNIKERLKFILNVQGTLLRLSSLLAKVFPKALAKNVFFWERWLVFKIYDASNERNFLYGLQLGSKKTKFKIKDENKNEASTGQNLIQPAAII